MIKVASYNMRKGVGTDRLRRPERILDVLNEIDADVIALQEADRRFGAKEAALPPELIARCTPYRHVPLSPRDGGIGWHGNAILVRRDIEITAHAHIDLPTIEPRGAVIADLEIAGAPFRVVGMHLDLSGLQRRRQARAIIDAVDTRDKMPVVLMGDLNEWTQTGGCLRDFAHSYRMAATGPSFHARRPMARLDRIMVGGGLKVTQAGVHHSLKTRHASDHLPIWAVVEPD
ncbi:Endonuclease [Sphingomonas antarctica]|uniref:endonuclease/exonuclease/phosphatase family protein n=1 Tax=Sphingomonas antarctica TaxID=2040274 RepID=UPI0039EC655A